MGPLGAFSHHSISVSGYISPILCSGFWPTYDVRKLWTKCRVLNVFIVSRLVGIALLCLDLKLWHSSHPWSFLENGGGRFMEEILEEFSRTEHNYWAQITSGSCAIKTFRAKASLVLIHVDKKNTIRDDGGSTALETTCTLLTMLTLLQCLHSSNCWHRLNCLRCFHHSHCLLC